MTAERWLLLAGVYVMAVVLGWCVLAVLTAVWWPCGQAGLGPQ
jgi:hypothetical protein